MKKFSLKPLGGAYIQKLCKSLFFIGLITTFCLTSCSDDDKDDVVTPIFPEKQNIICNAGETKEFTFETNTNWSLTSSAIWCKFEKNGMDEFILSGKAGTQTVNIIVTDDEQKVDNISIAKLELTMGGQTVVIGEVSRSAKGYELKIYDENGNEIQELEAGYQKYIRFKIKANFRFAATNLPGWAELEGNSLVGSINQEVQGGLKFIEDGNLEKYPIAASEKNVIVFSDEAGKASYSFKISYKGMDAEDIDITTPSSNMYGWAVSLDGTDYVQNGNGLSGSSSITYKNRIPYTIKTLNDNYRFVFIEKGLQDESLTIVSNDESWMYCEGEKGEVKLVAKPFDVAIPGVSERVGYVLAFSQAEYESIEDDLNERIFEDGEIAYKYTQNNLLIQLTQKEIKSSTDNQIFTVTDMSGNPIECTPYTGENSAYYKTQYKVNSISEIKEPISGMMKVTANFEMWDYTSYYLEDEIDVNGVAEISGETELSIYPSNTNGKDIFIIINDAAMIIVRTSNISTSGDDDIFSITNLNGKQIEYNIYDAVQEELGNPNFIIGGLTNIYSIKKPEMITKVSFNSSNIKSFNCYNPEENYALLENMEEIYLDNSTGKMELNIEAIYLNNTTFVVIIDENDTKYGLFVYKMN